MSRQRHDFGPATVWLGEKSGKYPDCNQMVVTGRALRVAIDASRTSHLIGADFDSADLAILSHVHEDHMAGLRPETPVQVPQADLAAIHSWPGMAAACGYDEHEQAAIRTMLERDFAYAPRPDATGYADGTVWDLGGGVTVTALGLPGHTPGHSALLVQPGGIAFIADIDLTGFGPYYGDANSSLSDFRASLAGLPGIPAQVWVTGHHRAIYTDRARLLADTAAYLGKIAARDERLLALLHERPRSLGDLVAARLLYPPGHANPQIEGIERHTIRKHLAELTAAGAVRQDPVSGLWFAH